MSGSVAPVCLVAYLGCILLAVVGVGADSNEGKTLRGL